MSTKLKNKNKDQAEQPADAAPQFYDPTSSQTVEATDQANARELIDARKADKEAEKVEVGDDES